MKVQTLSKIVIDSRCQNASTVAANGAPLEESPSLFPIFCTEGNPRQSRAFQLSCHDPETQYVMCDFCVIVHEHCRTELHQMSTLASTSEIYASCPDVVAFLGWPCKHLLVSVCNNPGVHQHLIQRQPLLWDPTQKLHSKTAACEQCTVTVEFSPWKIPP